MLAQPCTLDVDASPTEIRRALALCGLDLSTLPPPAAASSKNGEQPDED
jgi:hypothetical protein